MKNKVYFDSRRFTSVPIHGQHRFVYDSSFGVNWVTAFGASIERWAYWTVVAGNFLFTPWCFLSICHLFVCTEELPYISRLAAVMVPYADFCDEELTTHTLSYVALLPPFDRYDLLTNFEY